MLFVWFLQQAGLSTLMKRSPLVCCSASVFTRLSYCALLGKRERQEGARDKSLSRGQDISISPGFLSTDVDDSYEVQVCANPASAQCSPISERDLSSEWSTHGSFNYPCIIFWIYLFKRLLSCCGVSRRYMWWFLDSWCR